MFRDDNGDLASKGFLEGTIEALKAHHGFHNGNIVDEYEVAYSVCYDAVFVLSLYVGVGEVKALAQAGSFAKRIAILKGIVKNIPKSAIGSIKNIPKMLQKLPENTQKVLLTMANEALLHAPKTYIKALDTQIATLALYTNTSVEIARFTANGYVIISEASKAARVKNIIFTSAEDVTSVSGDSGKLILFADDEGKVFAKIGDLANAVASIPSSLATKLGNTLNIDNWLIKYADDLGDVTPLLNQLDNSIGTRNVLTHLEDAQGRLVTVIERPGQSNLVSVMHKDVNGSYKLTEFSPSYNPFLNPNIPVPLSANKLVPDYMGTQYMHPLQGGQTVKIKLSGTRNTDFTRARAELGITKADEIVNGKNYTWHHMDDFEIISGEAYCTMQLVESSAHQGTGVFGMQHSGSVAQWRAYFNSGY